MQHLSTLHRFLGPVLFRAKTRTRSLPAQNAVTVIKTRIITILLTSQLAGQRLIFSIAFWIAQNSYQLRFREANVVSIENNSDFYYSILNRRQGRKHS